MGSQTTTMDDDLIAAIARVHEPERLRRTDPKLLGSVTAAIAQAFEREWDRVRAADRIAMAQAAERRRKPAPVWTREGMLARIVELRALLGGQLQLAHRKLEEMTDDDIRTLIDDLESIAARSGKRP
jgi:hypothetical protein